MPQALLLIVMNYCSDSFAFMMGDLSFFIQKGAADHLGVGGASMYSASPYLSSSLRTSHGRAALQGIDCEVGRIG
jgi:hypothetical protein